MLVHPQSDHRQTCFEPLESSPIKWPLVAQKMVWQHKQNHRLVQARQTTLPPWYPRHSPISQPRQEQIRLNGIVVGVCHQWWIQLFSCWNWRSTSFVVLWTEGASQSARFRHLHSEVRTTNSRVFFRRTAPSPLSNGCWTRDVGSWL